MRLRCNGALLEDSTIVQLTLDVPAIATFVPRTVTPGSGDIIASGTPVHGGFASDRAVFREKDDIVAVAADGIGKPENQEVAVRDDAEGSR